MKRKERLDKEKMAEFEFQNVWSPKNQELLEEIVSFWNKFKAIPPGDSGLDRAKDVVFIARDQDGKIAAVSTVKISLIKFLKLNMFYFRCFVAPDYRRKRLMTEITVKTRDFLENEHQKIKPVCAGMIAELQNPNLNTYRREAVFKASGLTFIGYNSKGFQTRIYYFKGATI